MSVTSLSVVLVLCFDVIFCRDIDNFHNFSCPTWLFSSEDRCICGSSLNMLIMCNNETQGVQVLWGFCLTSSENLSRPVVGRCLYAQSMQSTSAGLYVRVNPNISKQDNQLCSYLNRQGSLCGNCKANHFVSSYSFDLMCHQCHRGLLSNIILYITLAYGPLTVFLIAVMAFHITVTSPSLNAVILVCQIFTLPGNIRYAVQFFRNTNIMLFVDFVATIYGVWNLDFFRILSPPICLPLNIMQVIALDYLVAGYPLLLLVLFNVFVRVHDKGYWLVVRLCRPFLWCTARMRQHWNFRSSIIHAFATFLLLSYMKMLNTSVDLLLTTKVVDIHGSRVGYYLYYDATVEFMGSKHMPYAILAFSVLMMAALFPLFLVLYPMKWFQRYLNKYRVNCSSLRMLVECFQGSYRDVTDAGVERRYFSAVYPTFRIGGYVLYAVTESAMFFSIMALVMLGLTATILVIRPYKKQYELYNLVDALFVITMIVYCTGYLASSLSYDRDEVGPSFGHIIMGIATLVPILYFSVLLWKKMKHNVCICFVCKKCHICQEDTHKYEELSESDKLLHLID